MKFSEAFRETLFRFNIQGRELAEKSGVSPAQVSRFRNGHTVTVDTLERFLNAMQPEARAYMLELVAKDESFIPK